MAGHRRLRVNDGHPTAVQSLVAQTSRTGCPKFVYIFRTTFGLRSGFDPGPPEYRRPETPAPRRWNRRRIVSDRPPRTLYMMAFVGLLMVRMTYRWLAKRDSPYAFGGVQMRRFSVDAKVARIKGR
jgi:hypothetical protein